MDRPRPEIIRPPEQGNAPSDAIVLFDGSSFDAWELIGKDAWNHIGKPGEWQSYDIVYIAPKTEKGKNVPAQLTVFHNGILIQYAVDPGGRKERIKIRLQSHNNPVRYRNIWVRELDE